jgi:hypothetical protein
MGIEGRSEMLVPIYRNTLCNIPYDQKDQYTLIPGVTHYGFRCDAGEIMSGGDATTQHRLAQDLEQSARRLGPGHCTIPIHDILPTKERLHRIALADTAHCTHCGQLDTLSNRLIDWGAGKEMWHWTQGHLEPMLRTLPYRIPDDWPLRHRFSLWPPQRHGAVLWVLVYFVYYRVQYPTTPTLQDFADFMRRARWKAHPLP